MMYKNAKKTATKKSPSRSVNTRGNYRKNNKTKKTTTSRALVKSDYWTGASSREHYKRGIKHATQGVGELALGLAEEALKMMNVEFKNHRETMFTSPTTVCDVFNIFDPAQGDGADQRNGDKVKVTQLQISGYICNSPSASAAFVHHVIVIDRAGTTTPPTVEEVWGSESAFYNGYPKLSSPQSNSRFQILLNRVEHLNNDGDNCHEFEYFKKLEHHVYFSGPNVTDEGRGSIWMFAASNQPTNKPTVTAQSLIKYVDN